LSLSAYYTINRHAPEKALAFLPASIAFHEQLMARLTNETLLKTQKFILCRLRNNLGNAFAETQQVDRAIQEHEQAAALMPDSHEPWFYLGMDYEKRAELFDQGAAAAMDRKKALEQSLYSYEECIRKNPRHAPAYGNMGLVLYQLGRMNEAEHILRQALHLSPNNFKMAGLLAEIFAATGRSDTARALLERSIAQARYRSDDVTVAYMSQQLAAIGQGTPAGAPAAAAVQGTPGFQEFVSLFQQKRYADALAVALVEEKKMAAPDAVFINNIGMAFYKTGDLNSAETYFTRAIALNESYDKAYYNLALVYTRHNDIDQAIAYCRKALAINPQYRAAQNRLDGLLQAKKQTDYTP
jgi:tetratricopeptide (TPR) repeat protein